MSVRTRRVRNQPTPEPRFSSLMEVATVLDDLTDPLAYAPVLYPSLNCILGATTTLFCPDQPQPLDFAEQVAVNGIRFVLQHGVFVESLGVDWNEVAQRLDTVRSLTESRGVEQAIMWSPIFQDQATDLTPAAGAVSPKVGLAILEADAAQHYSGLPTIHLPYTVGSLLFGVGPRLERVGSGYRTPAGSKIVLGAGYEPNVGPDGTGAPDGEQWIYATGEVTIERGAAVSLDPILDRETNHVEIVREAVYVADADCYAAAVRVSVE